MAPVSEQAIMHKVAVASPAIPRHRLLHQRARPHQRRDRCVDHEQITRLLRRPMRPGRRRVMLARIGARRWITAIMLAWGLCSGASALVSGVTSFVIVRFMLGAAEAGYFSGVILFMTCWFPNRHRGTAMGAFYACAALAVSTGAPISGNILALHGWLGLQGWQWIFLLEAAGAAQSVRGSYRRTRIARDDPDAGVGARADRNRSHGRQTDRRTGLALRRRNGHQFRVADVLESADRLSRRRRRSGGHCDDQFDRQHLGLSGTATCRRATRPDRHICSGDAGAAARLGTLETRPAGV